MDEGNTLSFCITCGTRVQTSDRYCPSCGNNPRGGPGNGNNNSSYGRRGMGKLSVVALLGFMWAACSILLGAVLLIVFSDPNLTGIENILSMLASIHIISGICAAICSILCLTRKFYILALALCLIGSILALSSIIGIVGILCVFWIYQEKYQFTGQSATI
jgi:hypothetical protein